MSERRKVTVVGAGNVGATCVQELARRDYADVVVVDIKQGLPEGKALDVNQAGAVLGYEPNVVGSMARKKAPLSRPAWPRASGSSAPPSAMLSASIMNDSA